MADRELTGPERAALDAWSRVSPDTTGMLYAVRAALAVEDSTRRDQLRAENERLRRDLAANEDSDDAALAVAEADVARLRRALEGIAAYADGRARQVDEASAAGGYQSIANTARQALGHTKETK